MTTGHLHILGICGTLMGSLALLARELGFEVSGSDANVYPPMSDQLMRAGIRLHEGYSADALQPTPDLVMIGNAGLPRGNPAVEAVLNRRLPYISGAEWLGRYVMPGRWVIAVSGTHGKTTTTAMITWILEQAGLNPGYLIGGIPTGLPGSARLGDSAFFVVEADEYDTSYFDRRSKFMHYRPDTLVINNLEFDHADIFDSLADIEYQFHHLLRTVPGDGLVICPQNDVNVNHLLEMGCWTPVQTFSADGPADWQIDPQAAVTLAGRAAGELNLPMAGTHNLNNALAAIAAARHAGVPVPVALAALATFPGVKRRMETIYSDSAVTVYDDFAHHPTAIQTTLVGLRATVGDARVLAVIEPASHTMRRGTLQESLKQSAGAADLVFWYAPDAVSWDIHALGNNHTRVIADIDSLLDSILLAVKNHAAQHVVIMSNGGFGGLHGKLVTALEAL